MSVVRSRSVRFSDANEAAPQAISALSNRIRSDVNQLTNDVNQLEVDDQQARYQELIDLGIIPDTTQNAPATMPRTLRSTSRPSVTAAEANAAQLGYQAPQASLAASAMVAQQAPLRSSLRNASSLQQAATGFLAPAASAAASPIRLGTRALSQPAASAITNASGYLLSNQQLPPNVPSQQQLPQTVPSSVFERLSQQRRSQDLLAASLNNLPIDTRVPSEPMNEFIEQVLDQIPPITSRNVTTVPSGRNTRPLSQSLSFTGVEPLEQNGRNTRPLSQSSGSVGIGLLEQNQISLLNLLRTAVSNAGIELADTEELTEIFDTVRVKILKISGLQTDLSRLLNEYLVKRHDFANKIASYSDAEFLINAGVLQKMWGDITDDVRSVLIQMEAK